ncbi:MAG: stage II sporulation protein M [Oscillospiraceae bacterium]|jgi:uncharacterized membrane protein SpoIIM required for sporulation|nr:stage II sporulation protein M [Oscillospiraceae bacterium]
MNTRTYKTGFFLCAALFVCGCAAGVAASGLLTRSAPVGEYISGLSESAGSALGGRFASSFLSAGKFHLAALLFAFSVLGVAGIPSVAAVRGFLLCFAMSSVIRFCGSGSVWAVLAMFSPEAIISVPCLFVLSAQSFNASAGLLRAASGASRGALPFSGGFLSRGAACAALLAVAALIEAIISPGLVARIVSGGA